MADVWKHHPGYSEARAKVQAQSTAQDLKTIDSLYGRDNLKFGDGPAEIKAEALRQLEIEWRSEKDETATFWTNVAEAERKATRGF